MFEVGVPQGVHCKSSLGDSFPPTETVHPAVVSKLAPQATPAKVKEAQPLNVLDELPLKYTLPSAIKIPRTPRQNGQPSTFAPTYAVAIAPASICKIFSVAPK